jgi:hypothetical protein
MRYAVVGLLVTAAITLLTFLALDLLPPRQITMAAGAPGTAYHRIATAYREILAEDGIELVIVETAGSVANAAALAAGADVAILQGGVPAPAGTATLAAILLEPMFVIHRAGLDASDPGSWGDLRIAAGVEGSGTRAAVIAVLAALGDPLPAGALLPLGTLAGAEALAAGQVDAAIFVAPVDAPYLEPLLHHPELRIAHLRDLPAVAARLDFVEVVEIPAAGIDYLRRLPPEPVQLPAMVGRLVGDADLHPALVDRLVTAAQRIHRAPDLVTREGRFPAAEGVGGPLNPRAGRLLNEGTGVLSEILPYWAVAQINRFAVLLLPVLFLVVPFVRALPALYAWGMQSRIWKHYDAVVAIDMAGEATDDPAEIDRLLDQLAALETRARAVRVARRFRADAYALRLHIDLVRGRLRARLPAGPGLSAEARP